MGIDSRLEGNTRDGARFHGVVWELLNCEVDIITIIETKVSYVGRWMASDNSSGLMVDDILLKAGISLRLLFAISVAEVTIIFGTGMIII